MAKVTVKTTANADAWREIVSRVNRSGAQRVRAGILHDPHLAFIGKIHEYGAPRANIVERSWMRSVFKIRRDEIIALQKKLLKLFMARKITELDYLETLGDWIAKAMQDQIVRYGAFLFQPLKPATVKRKGSNMPLVDTQAMANAITWQVRT